MSRSCPELCDTDVICLPGITVRRIVIPLVNYGLCQRVFTPSFKRRCQHDKSFISYTLRGYYIRNNRSTLCYCSRLIEDDYSCLACLLQSCCSLKQDTVLCTHSISNHDRNRCGKSQRTRAADHKYRYSSRQRVANFLSGNKPYDHSNHCNSDDHRHEHP